MSTGPIPVILDEIAHARNVRLDAGIWIISQSLLMYDYILTFKYEVEYVWSCPWSVGLILFYLNRYLPIVNFVIILHVKVASMQVKSCESLAPAVLWITTCGLLASQAIIVLRTYAVWGRRRLIFIILVGWTIVFPGTLIIVASMTTNDIRKLSEGSDSTAKITCPTTVPATFIGVVIFYVTMFVGEAVIVILTGIKAKQHMQRSSPSWVHELYQNGILQCISMLSFSLLNAVMMFKGAPEIKMSILPMQCNLHSVFCNRVIFLLLENRRARKPEIPAIDNHRQSGTLYIFTTVHLDPLDTFQEQEQERAWQVRAEREWVR